MLFHTRALSRKQSTSTNKSLTIVIHYIRIAKLEPNIDCGILCSAAVFLYALFLKSSNLYPAAMNTINNFPSSSDQKATIIREIQKEAAVANARQLIQVRLALSDESTCLLTNYASETQFSLLRKMHPVARKQLVEKGRKLFHAVHGKVHGHLEYCEQAVYQSNTKIQARSG